MGSMTKARKSEKEIDNLVVAQAEDDSAWEPEIHVAAKRFWRFNPSRVELAAKFFVLSALHRLDAHVAWTWGDPESDIALIDELGHARTIEVKVLTGSRRWRVEDFHERQNHFIIFVCFVEGLMNPRVPPEIYVLPSAMLRNALVRIPASEVVLSELGGPLNAREGWHHLLLPETVG
jgi:hypothetical protein